MNQEGIEQLRSLVLVESRNLEELQAQLAKAPKDKALKVKVDELDRKLGEYLRLLANSQESQEKPETASLATSSSNSRILGLSPSVGSSTGSLRVKTMLSKKLSSQKSREGGAVVPPPPSAGEKTGGSGIGQMLRRSLKPESISRQDPTVKVMQSEPANAVGKRWSSMNVLSSSQSTGNAVESSPPASPANTARPDDEDVPFSRNNRSMRFASVEDFRRASVRVQRSSKARPMSMAGAPQASMVSSNLSLRDQSLSSRTISVLITTPTDSVDDMRDSPQGGGDNDDDDADGLLNVELTELDLSPTGAATLKLADLGNNVASLALTRCRMQDLSKIDLSPPLECPGHTNLMSLSLVRNDLRVAALSDPDLFKPCTALKRLYLGYNKLESVPPAVLSLSWLITLGLSHNEIKALPPTLGRLKKLEYLSLDSNQLTELHPSLLRLRHLRGLVISNNSLYVEPNELRQLHNFCTALAVSGNPFLQPDIVHKRRLVKAGKQYRGVRVLSLTPGYTEDDVESTIHTSVSRTSSGVTGVKLAHESSIGSGIGRVSGATSSAPVISAGSAAAAAAVAASSAAAATVDDEDPLLDAVATGSDTVIDDEDILVLPDNSASPSRILAALAVQTQAAESISEIEEFLDEDLTALDDVEGDEDELPTSVAEWLDRGGMIDYLSFFENAGFKTLPSCTTITLEELDRLNIVFGPHRKAILDLVEQLKTVVGSAAPVDYETSV